MRVLLLLSLLAACVDQGPYVPPGAIPWTPPAAQMDSLWQATEACSGLTGDWHGLRWYIVPAPTLASPVGDVKGLWDGDRSIYFAEPNFPTWTPWPYIIRHEMLHALTHSGAHGPLFDTCDLR